MKFKLIFISIIWLFSMGCYSQENLFYIEDSIVGLEEGSVQICVPKSDSTFYVKKNMFSIVNGEFIIAGHLEFPRTTVLVFSNNEDQVFQTE